MGISFPIVTTYDASSASLLSLPKATSASREAASRDAEVAFGNDKSDADETKSDADKGW